MSFKSMLKNMNKNWKDAPAGRQGNPIGQFEVTLQNIELRETQQGGLRSVVEYIINDGEHSGKVVYDGQTIISNEGKVNETGLSILKGWIEKMGYDVPEDMTDLEDLFQQIAKDAPTATVSVKQDKNNSEYTRVTLIEVGESSSSDDEEEEEEEEEEEKPKKPITKKKGKKSEPEEEEDEEEEDEEEAEEEEEEEEEEGEDTSDILAFAQGFSVEGIDEDSSAEEIVTALKEYEIDGADLTDDERTLLTKYEIPFKKQTPAKKKGKK